MKASNFLFLGMLCAATLAHFRSSAADSAATNSAPQSTDSNRAQPGKKSPSREGQITKLVCFDNQAMGVINRKAGLYGLNPNLLHAVLRAELELRTNQCQQSEAEFQWMVEMSARTLRHCLDKESDLTWALDFYACGSFEIKKVDDRAVRFSRLALKHFRELEKASPWKP